MTTCRKKNRPESPFKETIFEDGNNHFQSLLKDIAEANQSIHLETYLFHNDILGQRITEALCNASQRGVRVRVMVDAAGSPLWGATLAKTLEKAGVLTKVFHPFPWQLWNWSRAAVKNKLMPRWIYFILKANSRNHRKICLIDKRIAYIGSFNISLCHLPQKDGGEGWRDLSVRLEQTDFTELHKALKIAWRHATIKERLKSIFDHIRQDPIIRLNYTRHRRRLLYKHLLRTISRCKKRIWITNAYFVPDNFLLRRLKKAAQSGVDVRILLPQKSDVAIMPWASSTFYNSLLKAGVRIFEYLPSVLHAKSVILDDWILIGSSNLNHRSILHDLEADARLSTEQAKRCIEQHFLSDLKASHEVTLTTAYIQRPLYQRILGHLVLYIKYWI